jgi:hypothetical protein
VVHDNMQQSIDEEMEVLNNRNQDEQEVPKAPHADDRVEQRSNAVMDDPRPHDERTDNEQ